MLGDIYIGFILICRVFQHIFNKRASNQISSVTMSLRYLTIMQLFSALLGGFIILFFEQQFIVNGCSVLISALSGSMLFFSVLCSLFAMKNGTVVLVSMFATAGLIVPTIAGIFLFHIPVSFLQWTGVAVFFVAAYLLMNHSKSIYQSFSLKTVLLLIGTLLSNGFTMLSQQMYPYYVPEGSITVFSFLSFALVGTALLLILPFISRRAPKPPEKLPKKMRIYAIILASCVFIINQLATKATNYVSPVILFTFINGGSTVIGAVVAAIMYKEKISLKTAAGILLGVSSLVMIKML